MAKISVIIPVYNVERYLRQCLDSVKNQTFSDIEVICVDDGSTDGSSVILEEYAAQDSRFRIIVQANGGLSQARNAGMDVATGKYIYFLDSDDWIAANALELMYAFAEDNQLEHVVFGCEVVAEGEFGKDEAVVSKKQVYYTVPAEYDGLCSSGSDLLVTLQRARHFFVSVPLRFFRLDCLRKNEVRFPSGILHEDEYFTPVALVHAKRAGILRHNLYYRRIHAGTITTTGSRHHIARRMAGCMAVLVLLQRVAKDLQGADRGAIEFRIRYLFRKCMAFVQANRGILSEATSCGCAFSDVPPEKMIALSRRIRVTCFKRRIRKYIGFLFAGKRK